MDVVRSGKVSGLGGDDAGGEERLQTLVIRADASARAGTGHVMRCLALAQGWRRAGGNAVFACAEITPSLETRLKSEGFTVQHLAAQPGSISDAEQTIQLLQTFSPVALLSPGSAEVSKGKPISDLGPRSSDLRPPTSDCRSATSAPWLVADGYHFDAAYQRAIKDTGLRLLLVDDYGHAEHYSADLVLNQNLSAHADLYANRDSYTRVLLGPRYVLLRQQFLAYKNWQREIPAVARKVLVTLGGTDPDNVTGKVIEALCGLDVDARIVVGGSNPCLERLQSQVSGHSARLSLVLDTQEMPSMMAWADLAVAAGGSTSWELALMGLPSLVLVLADNQIKIAAALQRENIGVNVGFHEATGSADIARALVKLLSDQEQRAGICQRGRQLVDGHGVERIVELLSKRAGQILHSEASLS